MPRSFPAPMPAWAYNRHWRTFTFAKSGILRIRHCRQSALALEHESYDREAVLAPLAGFIVRRKQGNAVKRNRIKRVLRHTIADCITSRPDLRDLAIIVDLQPSVRIEESSIQASRAILSTWLTDYSE